MRYGNLVALAAALLLMAEVAAAQSRDEQWKRCEGEKADPDLRIAACGTIIASGKETTRNQAGAYYNRGNAYRDQRQYDRAIADFDQSIALNPSFVPALVNRGNVYTCPCH
jgi:tetratricopeptide (TPR) repeat protein